MAAMKGLSELARLARQAQGAKRPPLHLWNPEFCGDIDMRIARDGTWYYLGSAIGRQAMVKLFATVLKREGEDFFLVTPVEKIGIRVDDAPFVAVELDLRGKGVSRVILFRTNVGDVVEAGPDHPIRVETDEVTGEPSPYVLVRDRLEALIARPVFYELVTLGTVRESEDGKVMGVWSGGEFFTLGALGDDEIG